MLLATLGGQTHLMLSLPELFSPLCAGLANTVRTADTVLKVYACQLFFGQRMPACVALFVLTLLEISIYRDTLIEDKALTLPARIFRLDIFQILQNTAVELLDVLKSSIQQKRRSLFAANASGAEHGYLGVFFWI